MTLVDILKNPPVRDQSGCGVCKWLDSIPLEEQIAIREALSDPRWKTRDLADILRAERGLPVKENQLGVHRRGGH